MGFAADDFIDIPKRQTHEPPVGILRLSAFRFKSAMQT
jgi:hypothetical protein